MPHKIEITEYTETHCGTCLRWHGRGSSPKLCGPYHQIVRIKRGDTSPLRCPACIADEKAQREADHAD